MAFSSWGNKKERRTLAMTPTKEKRGEATGWKVLEAEGGS